MSFTTHLSIMNGIRNNDETAWTRFFDEYAPLIKLHGKDCGVPDAMQDDLVQNVMVSVFHGAGTFQYDPGRGRYRDFLRFVIRARLADLLRALYKKAKNEESLEVEEAQLDSLFEEEWREHVMKRSIATLKEESNPKHFQVFHMLDMQKREVKQVAKFFELPAATVYSIRTRMEERLRQIAKEIDVG